MNAFVNFFRVVFAVDMLIEDVGTVQKFPHDRRGQKQDGIRNQKHIFDEEHGARDVQNETDEEREQQRRLQREQP